MKRIPVRRLAILAMIAAIYAALTLALGSLGYSSVQFRISEALCVLPFFFPGTVWALFVGCVLANLLGPSAGVLDIVFGSLATLLACLSIAAIGKHGDRRNWLRCVAACLMPVVFNAVIVGAVLVYTMLDVPEGAVFWTEFLGIAASVGLGELVVMFVLGLPLLRWLPNSRFYGWLEERL